MQDKADLKVCIIDYGMGNLRSVYNKVNELVVDPILSSDPADILAADRLILPGVGHFQQGMKNLEEYGILEALQKRVLEDEVPILGICLGMQLFTKWSEEGDCEGLGWINARTIRFDASRVESSHFKIPHMGWNTLNSKQDSVLYNEMKGDEEFYFCHTYHVQCDDENSIVTSCNYGYEFTASVQKGNIHGVQYHPEKSHDWGSKLIQDFIQMEVPKLA